MATAGRLQLEGRWNVASVETPTAIVVGDERIAVLDAIDDEAVIAELSSGRATRVKTAATPIAGAFLGRELYLLARDARTLQHVGVANIPLGGDPSLLRVSGGKLYVYSRVSGSIEEVASDRVTRKAAVPPFASDFEISGTTAHLVYPREGRIRFFDLATMKASGESRVGAVPIDLAFAGGGTALTAKIIAVADPAAKRVWMAEGAQSVAKAFGRGFLRSFLGLGLFSDRSSEFPTGVDRVLIRGSVRAAYDTSSGTLYRFTNRKRSVVATGVAPTAFDVTDEALVYWQNGRVRQDR